METLSNFKKSKQNDSEEVKRKYNASKSEAKRAVAKTRVTCNEKLYQELKSGEDQKRMYKVANAKKWNEV